MSTLKVNGVDRVFNGDPNMPLLWYLRDTFGLTGTKFGFGMALCGACTVHKNGTAIRSCMTPLSAAANTEIRTIEARAQFEGAAVFGASIVRSGEITAKNGVIEQSNFNDYPVARSNEAPRQTNVYIVDSNAPPAGVGEPRCAAVRRGILQRNLRRHRQARPRFTALQQPGFWIA